MCVVIFAPKSSTYLSPVTLSSMVLSGGGSPVIIDSPTRVLDIAGVLGRGRSPCVGTSEVSR